METPKPALKPVRAFHPPLFALHPPLALYAANVSLIPWHDVYLPVLVSVAAGVALWALLCLALRDGSRAALAASTAIFLFYSFGPITAFVSMSFWLYALVTLLLCVLAGWKGRFTGTGTRFLNFVGSAICLLALGSIVSSHWSIRGELGRNRSRATTAAAQSSARLPDIFYFILDGYGRADTFERLYGFSDREFTDWLERKGFFVAKKARSNYVQTELSLASALNMAPIEKLVHPLGNADKERLVLDQLIDESQVVRELRRLGYKYFAVTSGFPALTFETADVVVKSDSGASLFVQALLEKTPRPVDDTGVTSMYDGRRQYLESAFNSAARLAAPGAAPKFVVVHILAPHPPFVFGPNGEPRRPKKGPFGFWDGSHYVEFVGTVQDYRDGYRDQAQYIAKRTRQTVEVLLSGSGPKPIILIQGDHGPKSGLDQNGLSKTDIEECFGILSAYSFPDGKGDGLDLHISPINSFGVVLSRLTGKPFPRLPDRSYFSTWGQPLQFIDVTNRIAR